MNEKSQFSIFLIKDQIFVQKVKSTKMNRKGRTNKKNPFTEYVKAHAIHVMHKIMSRPCAQPFIDCFPTEDRELDEDYEPIGLLTIVERLENNYYAHPTEWREDMLIIPKNTQIIFGKDSSMVTLSKHLIRIFEKEFELFVCYNLSKWSTLVGLLTYQLMYKMLYQSSSEMVITSQIKATLMQNYPFIPDCPDYDYSDTNNSDSIEPINLTENEQTKFLVAVSALRSREDVKSIAEIITEEQPNLVLDGPHASIMVDDLHSSTFQKLIQYTKKRFQKLGMDYYQ